MILEILSKIPVLRNLFLYKVTGKGREDNGHWYPAPSYWTWKWNQ